jgi:hypothetical protein
MLSPSTHKTHKAALKEKKFGTSAEVPHWKKKAAMWWYVQRGLAQTNCVLSLDELVQGSEKLLNVKLLETLIVSSST